MTFELGTIQVDFSFTRLKNFFGLIMWKCDSVLALDIMWWQRLAILTPWIKCKIKDL